jgi:hypothetical protein
VRPSGPRDRGRIFGNLLGLLVVVVTAGVLGFAIVVVLQNARPAGTVPVATPSSAPATSIPSSPGPSPSGAPTVAATPLATAVAATIDPATPAPTVFVPTVQIGRGYVTFGTDADQTLRVTDPKTTFALDEAMVWSAYLTEPADSADLRIRILRLDSASPSGQTLVREDLVKPETRSGQIFLRRLHALGPTTGPGLFTIEYVRGDEILAEGSFLILP